MGAKGPRQVSLPAVIWSQTDMTSWRQHNHFGIDTEAMLSWKSAQGTPSAARWKIMILMTSECHSLRKMINGNWKKWILFYFYMCFHWHSCPIRRGGRMKCSKSVLDSFFWHRPWRVRSPSSSTVFCTLPSDNPNRDIPSFRRSSILLPRGHPHAPLVELVF